MGKTGLLVLVVAACAEPTWAPGVVRVEVRGIHAPSEEATARAVATYAAALARYDVTLVVGAPGDIVVEWTPHAGAAYPGAVGFTRTEWDPISGHISSAHVQLRMDLPWTCDDACVSGHWDVEAAVAHELGHAIGLHHTGVAAATLYPEIPDCDVDKRDLHEDDLAALAALYGGG
jgi:predicted Zn-dependent protease